MHRDGPGLRVETDSGSWTARAVISATGTWTRPFLPAVTGRCDYQGRQLHTVQYRSPSEFAGQRVVVVGGGNSGAQIAADLAHAGVDPTWVTRRPPRYLTDDIDGRALFDAATARRRALDEGRTDTGGVASLGDIVAVPLVRPALAPFASLRLRGTRSHIATVGTRAVAEPGLHLLGYGDWTGPASATLIGVGRPARDGARDIAAHLTAQPRAVPAAAVKALVESGAQRSGRSLRAQPVPFPEGGVVL